MTESRAPTPGTGVPAGPTIRPLASGEARALATVMRRSFGGLAGMMFGTGKAAFVAEHGGRVVGGVTLGAFRIDAARRGGVVKWLFTLPEARGSGVASALVDRAIAWFEEQGVTDALACVEGHNAGSSNRFAERGFERLGFVAQVRRYGVGLARVAWHTNHLVDVGHFLWARRAGAPGAGAREGRSAPGAAPARGRDDAPPRDDAASRDDAAPSDDAAPGWGLGGLAATLALHVAFGVVMLARLGAAVDLAAVAHVALAVTAVVGVRLGATALAGRRLGLRLRYLPWETGLLLAGAITLVFGGSFVAPGGLYPRSRMWSAEAWRVRLARMAFAGAAAVVALGWLAWGAQAVDLAAGVAAPVLFYARILASFDVLVPIFPMTAFAGRRMLAASRVGWAWLAAATVGLWAASLVG